MAKYLYQGTYSAEGAKGLLKDGGSKRRAAVEAMTKALGGTVEAFYYAFGDPDVVVIVDVPDPVSASAVSRLSTPLAQCGSRPPCFSLPRKWTKPRKRMSSIVSQASNSFGLTAFQLSHGSDTVTCAFKEDEDLFSLPAFITGRQTLDGFRDTENRTIRS